MPLTPQDRLDIVDLAHRFENHFDARELDANAETMHEDVVFESTFGNFAGRAAYRAWLEAFYDTMGAGKRHLVTNPVVTGDGDAAQLTSYLTIIERMGPPRIIATALVRDTLRRTAGVWQFTHRRIDVDPGMFAGVSATEATGVGASAGSAA